MKKLYISKMDVAGPVMKVLGMSTNDASINQRIVVGTCPTQSFPYCHPWLLG
jgi:hypothetical protein